jgi:flagellar basal-body rod protein FlgB
LSDFTANLMIKALDGLSARAIVTANNIANSGSPNFRPSHVSFEQALASAATRGPEAVRGVEPRTEMDPAGSNLRLDLELASASSTATRYAALIEILGRQLQLDDLAISRNS